MKCVICDICKKDIDGTYFEILTKKKEKKDICSLCQSKYDIHELTNDSLYEKGTN
jgi:hypothetical protein